MKSLLETLKTNLFESRSRLRSLLFLFVQIWFSSSTIQAAHIYGGEISYTQMSGGRFVFTTVVYADCNGIGLPSFIDLNLYDYSSLPLQINSALIESRSLNASIHCDSSITGGSPSDCSNHPWSPMKMGVYLSDTIVLSGVPPSTGWTVSWSTCCWDPTIDNLLNAGGSGVILWTSIKPFTPAGQNSALAVAEYLDQSPVFDQSAYYIMGEGRNLSYSYSASDSNHDSLYYSWADLFDFVYPGSWNPPTNPTLISWHSNYDSQRQLPDSIIDTLNVGPYLDSKTGWVTYEPYTTGMFATSMKVESWRDGQLLNEIARVALVQVIVDPYNQVAPILQINTRPGSTVLGTTSYGFEGNMNLGDSIKIKVSGTDNSNYPGTNQAVHLGFVGQGDIISSPADSVNCDSPPCMLVQPDSGQFFLTSIASNTVLMDWELSCSQFVDIPGQKRLNAIKTFTAGMSNLFCINPLVSEKLFVLNLSMTKSDPPVPVNISGLGSTNTLSWQQPVDTGDGFGGYVIYFKPQDSTFGGWRILSTILDYSISQSTFSALPDLGQGYYTMSSISACGFQSFASDTLLYSTIGVRDQVKMRFKFFPNPSSGELTVNWREEGSGVAEMVILNMSGQELYQTDIYRGSNVFQLDLASGSYIIQLRSENKQEFGKLIIQ